MKFSRLSWMGAALLWTACIGTSAIAQDATAQAPAARPGGAGQGRGQGRGGFGAPPSLSNLPVSYLTWALTLTDDQKTKIQAIQDKVRTDTQDLRKPDASGQRPDRATLQPKVQALNDQAKKDIEAVLTPAQVKKSEGALKSAGNYNAVGIPLGVVADLKLTSEEETKLADIAAAATKEQEANQKAIADARTAGDQQKLTDLNQARQTARTATQEKALAVLTDEQKAAVAQYQKDHPRGNRGGGTPPPAPAAGASKV